MNQARISQYEQLPTRERMKPRNATKVAARTEASHWDRKRKKGVDRQKLSDYLNDE